MCRCDVSDSSRKEADGVKKIVDDLRTIHKCCSLYYEDHKNQQEICESLQISRATVSRMLKAGREQGIVTITVTPPVRVFYGDLEKELEARFGLKEIIVAYNDVFDSKGHIATRLSEEAGAFLNDLFKDGDYIGVSMGQTIHNITKIQKQFTPKKDLMFLPLMGGISQRKIGKEDVQSNEIAARFAKLFGGKYLQFLSPAVFSSSGVLEGFLQEESINYIFDYYKKLDTVVMGVGVPEREKSTVVNSQYVDKIYLEKMIEKGAIGDIALRFFNEAGDLAPFQDFNNRVASISIEQLKKVRNRVAIASGAEKAEAVKGAIRAGLLNILIADVACAENMLK
jgi:DNA-binding transcriptional regulator LsrR (DeoR family)